MSMPNLEEVILTEDQKAQLDELSAEYKEVCDRYKELEAKKNALNSVLKTMFETYGVSKYTSSDDISITISKKPNVSFDEVKLLHYCKGLSIDGLVKQKEYVDMTVLEESIYRDSSIKESIKGFQVVKPDTVTLRCTQKKKLNE